MYGHSPFGAASVARRGKPAWYPSHMLVFPHTPPSEHVVLGNKCAHRFPCHAALRAFGRCPFPPSELGVSVLSCMCKRLEKLVTRINNRSRCRRQSHAQLTPRTVLYIVAVAGGGRHLHRAQAIHQCTVLLYQKEVNCCPSPAVRGSKLAWS